jgi:hypothetical protein
VACSTSRHCTRRLRPNRFEAAAVPQFPLPGPFARCVALALLLLLVGGDTLRRSLRRRSMSASRCDQAVPAPIVKRAP